MHCKKLAYKIPGLHKIIITQKVNQYLQLIQNSNDFFDKVTKEFIT